MLAAMGTQIGCRAWRGRTHDFPDHDEERRRMDGWMDGWMEEEQQNMHDSERRTLGEEHTQRGS